MPGYPELQNKIWKYDWAPDGAHSSTRKYWRMIVVVPDPDTRPLRIIAAAFYAKSATKQLSPKELVQTFASIMAATPGESPHEIIDHFQHVSRADGRTVSICRDCGDTWVEETIEILIDLETGHVCSGPITATT